jgi:hypothetical protein
MKRPTMSEASFGKSLPSETKAKLLSAVSPENPHFAAVFIGASRAYKSAQPDARR